MHLHYALAVLMSSPLQPNPGNFSKWVDES
uniref:Uncharacterized protein MANES_16G022800 n=1 Tax=Rhizophora mucronata TaxID=61149 RepID=A0A2P2IUD5_RHIMU